MVPASLPLGELQSSDVTRDLLQRVKAIEDHLGLSSVPKQVSQEPKVGEIVEPWYDDEPLDKLWEASAVLERCVPGPRDGPHWRRSNIRHLWKTFHDKMPGLHFLPSKQKFSSPGPILLAAMLYCSSVRGAPEHAAIAPGYFTILCCAISQLSIPCSEIGLPLTSLEGAEEYAFQVVLGLVLAGLLNEGNIRETGIWISIAYRLVLEHCPPQVDERYCDWRRLFNGVQIVDLEHASLHLSSPVIPIEPPLAVLQVSHRDQLYRLSRMMHTGLSHFSGRGLPTIWSCFSGDVTDATSSPDPFSPVDAAVIRDWARNLDDWLVEFTKTGDDLDSQRKTVFRQYVLHRLVVLSIYHPAKGCNLRSSSISLNEQHELLVSARATLKLHYNDKSIWSNWDLVIISWAALIVIHGIEAGVGESDDLRNIRVHLDMLQDTNEPIPNLRTKLAAILEQNIQRLHTPSPSATNHMPMQPLNSGMNLDYSWQIFDQAIMSEVMDPFWLRTAEIQHNIQ
ncbi:fungal transcriptional regulatory protein [Pochonia chlamydosporia 170]|uniref:Fungal transcriptional regulatory protein n=1 Tax=Pochonia chlamydosporia 170 TaxID=1380566 RepID=A0A179FKJ3_METCM|nr:fungal transcriptional regulatory protein [Pochonia chlamydosporia 170]OAQ65529.1 fungal transcriptional regulatory protein [Pochonia chlamydosporia 170]